MEEQNTYTSYLCMDCAMVLAKGEVEDPEPNWDEAEEALKNLNPREVTFGSLDEDYNAEDEEAGIDTFSREECYACGTRQGGTRYTVTIWEN